MHVHESYVEIHVAGDITCVEPPGSMSMRVHLYAPQAAASSATRPAVCVFSEIYQVTGPLQRFCRKLAGELGVIAACPESYHEFERCGNTLTYDVAGTNRGNELKVKKPVSNYDSDAEALVAYLKARSDCNGRIGAVGMCLGGHLAWRCGLVKGVSAIACLFATDIHSSSLGLGGDDTLTRIPELALDSKEMLIIWGKQDGHVPAAGRALIREKLDAANVDFSWCELNAQHAFVRDELSKGRYDPALTSIVHQLIWELFHRRLVLNLPSSATVQAQGGAPGPEKC